MLILAGIQPMGLAPVNLEIASGECVAIGGPSGSGKTLLLRAVADLDPCAGEVILDGNPRSGLAGPDWRRRVVYLASDSGWWAERVADHFGGWERMSREARILGFPGDWGHWTVARLSTGERQRLALLRALELEPAALLLDEPTSGLDADATAGVERIMQERLRNGMHVLWVTHDDAQAKLVARRRGRLLNGELTVA